MTKLIVIEQYPVTLIYLLIQVNTNEENLSLQTCLLIPYFVVPNIPPYVDDYDYTKHFIFSDTYVIEIG